MCLCQSVLISLLFPQPGEVGVEGWMKVIGRSQLRPSGVASREEGSERELQKAGRHHWATILIRFSRVALQSRLTRHGTLEKHQKRFSRFHLKRSCITLSVCLSVWVDPLSTGREKPVSMFTTSTTSAPLNNLTTA